MEKELCSLCDEPTGGSGEHDDSIYLAINTPAQIGPLCETCRNTILSEEVVEIINSEIESLRAELEKYKAFYHTSVEEHRKSIELIDSLEGQIEVLRPVYEAAKILQAGVMYGKALNTASTKAALFTAVNEAAMDLEDSNE